MNASEVINYWNSKNLLAYGQGFELSGEKIETEIHEIEFSAGNLFGEIENPKLSEFIGLCALGILRKKIRKTKEFMILVKCKENSFNSLYPLVYSINKEQSLKENISNLFNNYKELYSASQFTNQGVLSFINEKEALQNKSTLCYLFLNEADDFLSKVLSEYENVFAVVKNKLFIKGRLNQDFAESLSKAYSNITKQIIESIKNQKTLLPEEISFLNEEERLNLLSFSRGKKAAFEEFEIFDCIKKWAENEPKKIALRCGEAAITYKDLLDEVQILSEVYKNRGIKKGDRIFVEAENKILVIIRILAIWKLGAVYVPVSKSFSEEKIESIKAQVLQKSNDEKKADDAYIILTSGTTGIPKVVSVGKKGFCNLLQWYKNTFEFNEESVSLLLTNYLFDASVKNIAISFICGGTLVLPDGELFDVSLINQTIKKNKVTHINLVPSLMEKMIENDSKALKSLKWIILGGEGFRISEKFMAQSNARVANVYGPTEATDLATFHEVKNPLELPFPIGKPIDNKQVYILDENLKLLPPYFKGELYIGGEGVVSGYVNVKPEGVFFENPFFEKSFDANSSDGSSKLYRTGDLGYFDKDGNIIYCGRKDNQIKLNGQRIELEEIDSIANSIDKIKNAAAVIKDGVLTVCYALKPGMMLEKSEIKNAYRTRLSKSLQPNKYILMEDLPLTRNGKVDRKTLQNLCKGFEENRLVPPQNAKEELILQAWKETLGLDEISVETPFFEAGGDSLLLNKLKIELDKRIKNKLAVTDFFEYGTIRAIAKII